QLERWIVQKATAKGGKMHPRSAAVLAQNAGNDLALLDNEIEKLVLFKGVAEASADPDTFEPAEISPKDIELLSPGIAEANIFDLVDALGNRNGAQASRLLQRKLDEGTEPFLIFSMFIRQFRLLIQVKELADKRVTPPEIAKTVRIHKFVAQKLSQQCRSFSIEQLERIYRHLLDIDVRVKTGKEDIVTALNMLIFSLT
ncbi:MAG: DNA polymerase III subunit delta, partial [Chloroflexota bacterium]